MGGTGTMLWTQKQKNRRMKQRLLYLHSGHGLRLFVGGNALQQLD
jgi:hypothetical protein